MALNIGRLQIALEYAARGWRVLPLHTPDERGVCSCHKADCAQNGKHPRTIHGKDDATTETAIIENWWQMWPEANIGIATGADTGFVVLDVDPKNGGGASLKALLDQHGVFTEKVYATTGGGGWHILFAHPGGNWPNTQSGPNKSSKLGAGLDFRGDGGYIVAPGSVHASGKFYEWGAAPNGHCPTMPEWLKGMLRQTATAVTIISQDAPLSKGDRHPALLTWAGSMRRKGMSSAAILAALRVENTNRCNPPKEDRELINIANFVGNKSPEDPVLTQALEEVQDVPSDTPGLYTLDAYESDLDHFRQHGLPRGLHPGWNNLAEFYTVLPGSLTMVTGSPTAGKSHWMNALAVNMMLNHDWKFAVASPEFTPPAYFYSRFMETYAGMPFYDGPTQRIGDDLYREAKKYLREHLFFIETRNDEPLTIPFALSMAKRAREEYGAQGLILDPWAKFTHVKPDSMNETDYVRVTVNKILSFVKARDIQMHAWLVVHPKMVFTPGDADGPVITPYALPGSAHWFNLAENIISLYRRKSEKTNRVEVHVQKIKPHYIGREGVCEQFFERVTGQYMERSLTQTYMEQQSDPEYIPEF